MSGIVRPIPACLDCGSTEVKIIRSTRRNGVGAPNNYTITYQCECGAVFAETVKAVPSFPTTSGPSGSSPDETPQ